MTYRVVIHTHQKERKEFIRQARSSFEAAEHIRQTHPELVNMGSISVSKMRKAS